MSKKIVQLCPMQEDDTVLCQKLYIIFQQLNIHSWVDTIDTVCSVALCPVYPELKKVTNDCGA